VNTRRIGFLAAVLLLLFYGLILSMFSRSRTVLRPCGHRIAFRDRIVEALPYYPWPRHPCRARRLVNELKNVALAEQIFIAENGRSSKNLQELQTDGVLPWTPLYFGLMNYKTDGSNWSISVSNSSDFPGYYLVTTNGGIYFHESRPATQSDSKISNTRSSD
jgi:hypothetical protein